ncbi:MAG: DUF3226 domain-containing protein [Salinibacter sp.]
MVDLHGRRWGQARLHSWLAWQDPPGELIGRSIRRETGGLDPHSDLAERFVDWIRRLFPAQGEVVQE